MPVNYKAIVKIPAWASHFLEGGDGNFINKIETPAQAYAYVPLLRHAVRLRANALIRPRIVLRNQAGDEVDWPFSAVSAKNLLWNTEASLLTVGGGYIEKLVKRHTKKVIDLKWVNPVGMSVSYDTKNETWHFMRGDSGVSWTQEDMIYLREFQLGEDVQPGGSSSAAALNDAALVRFIGRFAATFFESGAMPVTIITSEGITDPKEGKRIERGLKKMMTGINKAFRLMFLNRAVDMKVISQPLKDMVFPELYDQAISEVAHAFEIPEGMLTSANNRSVTEEHRLSFWQDTVMPRGEWIADEFNRQLFDGMGLTMSLAFDELDVFQEDEARRAQPVVSLTQAINANPKAALWSMKVQGYEISDEMLAEYRATFLTAPDEPEETITAPIPTTSAVTQTEIVEPPAKSAAQADLDRWRRKALNRLEKGQSADCPFESDNIPEAIRDEITKQLPSRKTADDVRALFDGMKSELSPDDDGEVAALLKALAYEMTLINSNGRESPE